MPKKRITDYFKDFWKFLQEDNWKSFIVTLILAFIVIKFIFFPLLTLLTGTSLPLVIVESCSMHHYEKGFEKILENPIYAKNNITLADTKNWIFPDGFNKGDVIFVVGPKNIKVGDVIIFNANLRHPIIHRVISVKNNTFSTKGDNYKRNTRQLKEEKVIHKDQIVGKALFRIPFIGWIKLIFFEWSKPPFERGVCS